MRPTNFSTLNLDLARHAAAERDRGPLTAAEALRQRNRWILSLDDEGFTQAQIAQIVGCHKSQVSRVINAKLIKPRPRTA